MCRSSISLQSCFENIAIKCLEKCSNEHDLPKKVVIQLGIFNGKRCFFSANKGSEDDLRFNNLAFLSIHYIDNTCFTHTIPKEMFARNGRSVDINISNHELVTHILRVSLYIMKSAVKSEFCIVEFENSLSILAFQCFLVSCVRLINQCAMYSNGRFRFMFHIHDIFSNETNVRNEKKANKHLIIQRDKLKTNLQKCLVKKPKIPQIIIH